MGLTGEVVTDPATASKFWFDPSADGAYPEPLRDLGVDVERLPPVVSGAQATLPLRRDLRGQALRAIQHPRLRAGEPREPGRDLGHGRLAEQLPGVEQLERAGAGLGGWRDPDRP